MFDEWGHKTAKPPILLEKIDHACDEIEAKRFQESIIKKFYNLALNLRERDPVCKSVFFSYLFCEFLLRF